MFQFFLLSVIHDIATFMSPKFIPHDIKNILLKYVTSMANVTLPCCSNSSSGKLCIFMLKYLVVLCCFTFQGSLVRVQYVFSLGNSAAENMIPSTFFIKS